MNTLTSILIGVGLSASCGFRVFVPLLVIGLASQAGYLVLDPASAWLASWPAVIVFGAATLMEVAAYFVPWVDNVLDVIATPAALISGAFITAVFIPDGGMSPLWEYSIAAVAGGGAAGTVQASTVLLRGASTSSTGGLGNPLVSALELLAAIVLCIAAILLPIAVGLILLLFFVWAFRRAMRPLHLKRG